MMEQDISQPRQKVITLLHRSYSQALHVLKLGKFTQGVQLLQRLLQHEFINDSDTQNIKYSTLMSLAEVQQALGCLKLALGYYWQSLQILHHKSQQSQKGQIISRQHNEERVDQQFTVLLKMIFIVEKINLAEQQIYLLKRAIKLSPTLWREKLISKLQQVYEREDKKEPLADLIHLKQNRDQMEQILCQKQQIQQKTSDKTKEYNKIKKIAAHEEPFIRKITLIIRLNQSDDILLKYSNWETLLTLSYILLKCQNARNFNKKKYLHKKYDQGNKQWNLFLKKFSLTRTKIEIAFIKTQENVENIEGQNEHEVNWGKMIQQLGIELMKYKYIKKKSKKISNPLQQLTRIPSLNSKDPKKLITAQTKSIFTSVYQYYKELLSKSNFSTQMLLNLNIFNREKFDSIFGKIINNQVPQEMKGQGEQNQEEDLEGSFSMGGICDEADKDSVKIKKTLKQRKLQIISQNNDLNQQIPSLLEVINESYSITYTNTIEMIEKITLNMIRQFNQKQKKSIILNNISIRKILSKNILKVLQIGEGFFSELNQAQFFDLMMQKLEALTDKECKSKIFKSYQDQKRIIISNFIKQRFLPKTYHIQQLLQTSLSLNDLKYISHICQGFCKFYSLLGMCVPTQVAFYRELYIIFKKKLQLKLGNRYSNEVQLQKIITYFIEKQIQKFQKKATSKINIVNMKEEAEENANSIDQIYKKDKQISVVLPLLKILNCHPQQTKIIKSAQASEQLNGQQYLEAFIKLSQLFFKKIELESYKEFNCRLLILVSQIMRIKQVIAQLYQKFVVNNIFLKSFEVNKQTYTQTLYYVIRFYLLNLYEDNDNCLRIAFILTNTLLRQQPQSQKNYLVPKLICTFDQLIKYKKWAPETLNSVRKRFYQNLMLKNIIFIYRGPLLVENDRPKQSNKRYQKNKYARSDSQEQLKMQNQPKALELDNEDIKERVFDIIHDVYFCPEKDKQFNPKRMQQAIGYFMYLLYAYHQIFERKIIVLENDAIKIFKKCYRIYMDKRGQIYNYCDSFKNFKINFETVMNGEDAKVEKNDFISIIKQQKLICNCCSTLNKTHPFYVETLFVLGKYFEAQSVQPQLYQSKQMWLQEINKDQDYYFDYLALNLDKQSAWENIVRVNCTKSFYYFDSLLKQPFQKYKSKFLYTKRIIHFVNEYFPHFQDLTVFGSANLQILNILKIKEREYLMIQKKVELCGSENKQSKQLQKKYKEGVKKILQSNNKFVVEDVRIRYLRFSQIKLKLHWINLQKQIKEQKIQDEPVIIELDQESEGSKIIHKPTKNIEQIKQLLDEARSILKELPIQQQNDYVSHLEEDIVMECYIFLCKHLQSKLENIITSLCQSIGSNHQQKNKKIKQAQFMISDINYTLQFFKNGNLLTNNPRYRLKDQNLNVNPSQFTTIQSTFSNIFSNNEGSHEKPPEQITQKQPMQKEQIIVINDEQNEEIILQINRQRMDEQSKSIKRSNSNKSVSSKGVAKSKSLVLDVGNYLYGRFVRYIIQNKLFMHPLNHLQTFLYSQSIQQIIIKMNKILMQVSRVIIELPKYQIKKFRNRRSVVLSLIYCSHLSIMFAKNQDRTFELIKQYANTKSDQIVLINLYNQKIHAEKNQLLSDFYNRCIVHQIMKIQFIRHIFKVYVAQGNKDALVMLNRKLLKLSKVNQPKIEKDKNQKNQNEDSIMEIEGNKPKETSQVQVIQLNTSRQSKQSKDSIVTNNLSKQNKQGQKSLEFQFYYLLFCQGVIQFVQILKKQSQNNPVEDKYQKNLLQFKNRIKRNIKPDQKNVFFSKIDQFVTHYEERYKKKIKMKKPRKQREGANLPIIDQKSKQIQAIQYIQKIEIPINFHFERKKSVSQHHSESNHQKSPKQGQLKKERKIKKDQKQIKSKISKKNPTLEKKGQKITPKQAKKAIITEERFSIETVPIPIPIPLKIPSESKQKQLQKIQKKVQTAPKIQRPKREIKSKGQTKKSE